MTQVLIVLFLVSGVAFLLKDNLLALAALVLMIIYLIPYKPITMIFEKYSFQVGIFFLMIFLLFPLTNEKLNLIHLGKELFSPTGFIALVAGFLVSYIGGKGLGVLQAQPVVLFGVLLGTLVAVLFFRGLPAGLIIAAGIVMYSKWLIH